LSQGERELVWQALLGMLWPAATCAAVLALARLRTRPGTPLRAAAPGLALGLGFATGYAAIQGLPPLSFELTIRQWLFYAALALALFGLYEARAGAPKPLARGLVAALLPLLLLEFQRERHWTKLEAWLWSAGLAALVFVSWQLASAREGREPSAMRMLVLAFAGAFAALAYVLSGSVQLAQLGGALAVCLGLCALFALTRGGPGLGTGAGTYLVLHHGILWCSKFISELSWTSFALLALVPLAAFLPRPRSRPAAGLAALAPVLLAAAAALVERLDQPAADAY
jgi:hypothetical protein